jgi:drug/metabolite transporter (DMT)-like permease
LNIYPIVKLQASLAVLGVPMLYALVAPFRPRSAWNLNAWGWLGAAYGGIVSSFIAYLVITMCNRKLDPVSVVSYLPLQPLMASLIGTTLLGDDLHASLVVASVFLLSSVFLLVRGKLCDKRDEQELGAELPRWRHALQNASCVKMCHCSRINQIRHKDATGVRFHNV